MSQNIFIGSRESEPRALWNEPDEDDLKEGGAGL
jgi:hypothetical protein